MNYTLLKVVCMLHLIIAATTSNAQEITVNWQKSLGGSGDDFFTHCISASDGGYMLAGYSDSPISGDKTEDSLGDSDYWIMKVDSEGNIEWQETIGGDAQDVLVSLIPTTDGSYFLAGFSSSGISGDKTEAAIGGSDYWIMKVNSTGQILWQNTIGGSSDELLLTSNSTSDGGYILSGFSNSDASGDKSENSIGGNDYWVVKVNNNGVVEWENTIGGGSDDFLFTAIESTAGEYLLAGRSGSGVSGDKTSFNRGLDDYWIIKLDSSGAIIWDKTYGSDNFDDVRDIIETSDGGFILGGHSASNAGNEKTEPTYGGYDYWIIKIDTDGNILWQNTIGGTENDFSFHVFENSNQEIIAHGYSLSGIGFDKSESNRGADDFWIVGISPSGEVIWDKTLGGSGIDIGRSNIVELNDQSLTFGGTSDSNASGDKTSNSNGGFDFWFMNITVEPLGIADNNKSSDIIITQNKYSSQIGIHNLSEYALESFDLYDASGKLIQAFNFKDGSSEYLLDISQLSSGTYFLLFQDRNQKITRKFIKS